MNETVLYRERLPKYVFNAPYLRRTAILVQWWFRLGATGIFLATLFLIFIHHAPEKSVNSTGLWLAIIVTWIGCAILLNYSERRDQAELDGNVPTVIFEDRISIPPRLRRRLTGEQNFVHREQIDRIVISRGDGHQYTARKSGVLWEDAPIGIKIVTRSGKKISLGHKPPRTVKEIVEVLSKHWNVRIEDPGTGMGRGLRYINDNVVSEHSYDEIMRMNLFEWQ